MTRRCEQGVETNNIIAAKVRTSKSFIIRVFRTFHDATAIPYVVRVSTRTLHSTFHLSPNGQDPNAATYCGMDISRRPNCAALSQIRVCILDEITMVCNCLDAIDIGMLRLTSQASNLIYDHHFGGDMG